MNWPPASPSFRKELSSFATITISDFFIDTYISDIQNSSVSDFSTVHWCQKP